MLSYIQQLNKYNKENSYRDETGVQLKFLA